MNQKKPTLPSGIKKLPTGVSLHGQTLRIAFMYQGVQCKEPLKGLRITAANIKFAARQRESILYQIATQTFDYAQTFPHSLRAKQFPSEAPTTVEEALRRWLDMKEVKCAPSTVRGYEKDIRKYLMPRGGHYQFVELKKTDLEYWLEKTLRKLAPKTIYNLAFPL